MSKDNSNCDEFKKALRGWEDCKLVDSTLFEFAKAKKSTHSYGQQELFVSYFLENQSHIVVTDSIGDYQHNTAQYVQSRFFEDKCGFKKIYEGLPTTNDLMGARFEEINVDSSTTFRGYSNAAIGYQAKEGDKILVIISRLEPDSITYEVYADQKRGDLKKDWFAFASKENLYRGKKINASCGFLKLSDINWDDLILPVGYIDRVWGMIMKTIDKRDLLKKNNLPLKRGFLLSGAPGNGKTSLIKAIIKKVPISVIFAEAAHLMRAEHVKNVCHMAKDLAPCVLVIEDIDWIAEDRDTGDAGRVIQLMNELDGVEELGGVITIASTNDLEKIEKAVKNRPGRFDRVITIDNPNIECRRQMLKVFTKHWKLEGVNIEEVIKFSDGLSGAHMKELCITAGMNALDADSVDENQMLILRNEHFAEAVKEIRNKDFSTFAKKGIGFNSMADDDFLGLPI